MKAHHESRRLVGGFCGRRRVWEGVETHQRVITTRWWCCRQDVSPPTSCDDSWVVFGAGVVCGVGDGVAPLVMVLVLVGVWWLFVVMVVILTENKYVCSLAKKKEEKKKKKHTKSSKRVSSPFISRAIPSPAAPFVDDCQG